MEFEFDPVKSMSNLVKHGIDFEGARELWRDPKVLIVKTKGIGESDIVTILENENFAPANVDLGFYPGNGRVQIRLSAGPDREHQVLEAEQTLLKLLADHLELYE